MKRKYPIETRAGCIEALKTRPLRALKGVPMLGRGGLKPFRKPDGPVRTLPFQVRKTKPLRGVTE